ncbi:ion channel [Peribacillus sp. SCS-37]|uniref:ion channel n=1 Tax=Paraperibacillus esterisolvens TaxID=3115296 RepID=UPI003906712D
MINILLMAAIFCMFMSLKGLFTPIGELDKNLTVRNFIWLGLLYGTITLGFALIYLLLELKSYTVLLEKGQPLEGSYIYKLGTTLYFSSITFFSVGYGDLVPSGFGRIVASIQAFMGYALPAAFVVRSVFHGGASDKP